MTASSGDVLAGDILGGCGSAGGPAGASPAESAVGVEVGLKGSGAEDALVPQLGQNAAPDGIYLPQLEQYMMRLLSLFSC